MAHRTHLTPGQRWTVGCAPLDVLDDTLALELGINRSAVHHARWNFRRHGWSRTVRYMVCLHCGVPLTHCGRCYSRRQLHEACRRPEARASHHPAAAAALLEPTVDWSQRQHSHERVGGEHNTLTRDAKAQ